MRKQRGSSELRPTELQTLLLEQGPELLRACQSGDTHRGTLAARRFVAHLREISPDLANEILRATFADGSAAPTRAVPAASTLIDPETTSALVRPTDCSTAARPALSTELEFEVEKFIDEQSHAESFLREGLLPRSSVLLMGPPGTGKTMLARWVAGRLGMPLVQLELSAVISSFLGRTGQNLKDVLTYASTHKVVLLLDEFDAVAKRRDDSSDLGELKRIVSVLLKELEDWRGPSIVVAATNHPELIDPAIFRRFQLVLNLSLPEPEQRARILDAYLEGRGSKSVSMLAADLLEGFSGSDIRELAHHTRRLVHLDSSASIDEVLLRTLASRATDTAAKRRFAQVAKQHLPSSQNSLSKIALLLGVGRSTVHDYVNMKAGQDE